MIRSKETSGNSQALITVRGTLLLGRGVDMVLTLIITVPFNKQDKQETPVVSGAGASGLFALYGECAQQQLAQEPRPCALAALPPLRTVLGAQLLQQEAGG